MMRGKEHLKHIIQKFCNAIILYICKPGREAEVPLLAAIEGSYNGNARIIERQTER